MSAEARKCRFLLDPMKVILVYNFHSIRYMVMAVTTGWLQNYLVQSHHGCLITQICFLSHQKYFFLFWTWRFRALSSSNSYIIASKHSQKEEVMFRKIHSGNPQRVAKFWNFHESRINKVVYSFRTAPGVNIRGKKQRPLACRCKLHTHFLTSSAQIPTVYCLD